VSTPDGGNSSNPEKGLVVVGDETNSTDAAEGKHATAPDRAARGIFSKVVLQTESQGDYDSLVTGLRDACQPKGTLEEIVVEKLASILWRYRRLITAESGEIGENLSSLGRTDVRLKERDRLESDALRRRESDQGVIGMIYDPGILSDCLRELQNLRDRLEPNESCRRTEIQAVLTKLYGQPKVQKSGNIDICRYSGDSPYDAFEKFVTDKDPASHQRSFGLFQQAIEKEIQRLTEIQNALNESQPEQTELEQFRRNLPDADRMERLLRYEANLERAFDRTLAQLDRLQEIRLGRPVTRPLKFDIPA
jgi:hypothetical protein